MKITTTNVSKWLSYDELQAGEVYYTNGNPDPNDDALDGELYIFTEIGDLVALSDGVAYSKAYANGVLKRWRYQRANVELLEHPQNA